MSIWNTVTVARVGRAALACLAGVALAIVSASLAQATYGPRTTIGKSYQQWSDTQSGNGIGEGSCISIRCYILFQRVPQGKSLIVQHVSCRGSVDAGELRYGYVTARKGQIFPLRYTYVLPVKTSGTQWVVSHAVTHLVKSNERLVLAFFASTSANWSLACNISGRLE